MGHGFLLTGIQPGRGPALREDACLKSDALKTLADAQVVLRVSVPTMAAHSLFNSGLLTGLLTAPGLDLPWTVKSFYIIVYLY